MLLYQPTRHEIDATLNAARARHPHLGSRLDKAAVILADVNLNFDLDAEPWRIQSQTGPTSYAIRHTTPGASACSCTDYTTHAAKAPGYFCKHLIAYHAYRRILLHEMQRRHVGDYNYRDERQIAQTAPGSLLILRDNQIFLTDTYGRRAPVRVCTLRRYQDDTMRPASDGDYTLLAAWLGSAYDYDEPAHPRMDGFLPETQTEWQPRMNTDEYRQWIATGMIPALSRDF